MAASAKDIRLRPIPAADANRLIRRVHYSGKVGANSQVHIGVFIRGRLEGAMQFGPPLDRSKLLGLVTGTAWGQMAELNRLAFTERLPRNAESRALAVAFRVLRHHAPRLKWVVSFADATQCGDGTIYRAAGFVLTAINASRKLVRLPDSSVIHKMTLEAHPTSPRRELGGRSYFDVTGGGYNLRAYVAAVGGTIVPGYQLRYIRFLDPAWHDRLAVPVIPFSRIGEVGARMYRGQRAGSIGSDASADQVGEGGATPTPALQSRSIR
jgi:hypothetical protein